MAISCNQHEINRDWNRLREVVIEGCFLLYREWKVERLRHAEVAWKQSIEVPRDDGKVDDVNCHHDEDVCHRKLFVDVNRQVEVVPLQTYT